MSGYSFWSRFSELATQVGDVEAILAPDRAPLRFRDLPVRLTAIRDQLAKFGIARHDRVAAVLPHGPDTAVCYLGVASCASYMPLNPDYTEHEFDQYLRRLKPKAVILPSEEAGAARRCAEALGLLVLNLVVDSAAPAGIFSLEARGDVRPIPPAWIGSEDIALVLLTSGTTGQQKLVGLKQTHLLAYADAFAHHYRMTSADRCLHVMPMFHGHGLMATMAVPLACGTGVICPVGKFDIGTFFKTIETHRPTWYSAGYSIHAAIHDRISDYRHVARRAGLRFIRSGSGRLDIKVATGLEEAFGAPVVERYGMSETGTLASNPLPPDERRLGTVGKLFCNEVRIVDDAGNTLDPNRVGEIVTRGPTAFDGYLDDPEANAAAFVDGWFRTGDLGRFDEDGFLTIVGRVKDVINRGGEKIGTLEVEAALLKHPAVRDACVFSIPHPMLGEEVAAAIIRDQHLPVHEAELREHCLGLLTGFKVPRSFFFLNTFPKGASNKIQRDRVAQICRHQLLSKSARGDIGSWHDWSPVEREIARFWQAVLKVQHVNRDDDFFLIGGDSIKAAELFARLRSHYRIDLALRHIFDDAATITGMARLVTNASHAPARTAAASMGLVNIKPAGDRAPIFAVPGSGGDPVGFVHLARLLDERQPLIGLESRGLDGLTRPIQRMEDIAADNIERIRSLQPSGPYCLMGACYGARVAFEMARQLVARNETISLLIMLDPSAPFHHGDGTPRGPARRAPRAENAALHILKNRIVRYGASVMALKGEERRKFVREKLATLRDIVQQRDLFRDARYEVYQRAVFAANRTAGRHYIPGTYNGPVVLCFTRDRQVQAVRNYRMDWRTVIPQAGEPTIVPGKDSGDMLLPPHVQALAPHVNKWIEEALTRFAMPRSAAE